jgi:hypothetical protein
MLRRAASIAFWMATGTSRALPRPKADATLAVADNGERGETEDTAALDHLGHAVDLNQLLLEVTVLLLLIVKRHSRLLP